VRHDVETLPIRPLFQQRNIRQQRFSQTQEHRRAWSAICSQPNFGFGLA
jgi:hypothetical protein